MKVEYVNHMGDDNSIIDAARVSFSKSHKNYTPEQNDSLLAYLARGMSSSEFNKLMLEAQEGIWSPRELWHKARMTHIHGTPFAHTAITLRVQAPIPVRVHCFKSKIGFVESEESRRYITTKPEVFIPVFREKLPDVKQGSGDVHLHNESWQELYRLQCEGAVALYERMLKDGIAPEQARFVLPQGVEVSWIWTGSLLAYSRFWQLRSDSHAQKETQELAHMVRDVIKPLFPKAWELLNECV
jgi:thymidylate synthase, flavin-dependent